MSHAFLVCMLRVHMCELSVKCAVWGRLDQLIGLRIALDRLSQEIITAV